MLEILSYEFMQNALIAGILVSIACGIIGSLIVINKMSFIAGGMAHGAYGGIGIAFFIGVTPIFCATIWTLFLAILVAFITYENKNSNDAIIGAIWSFGMAIGIIFVDITPGYNPDLMSYLFGSILAVPKSDLLFISFVDFVFFIFVVVFYRQICAISFDMEFAKLRGVNVKFLYYCIICAMSLCVMICIQVVGLILVIALMTIPPFIAQNFSKSLLSMMIKSCILSLIFTICGLFLSYKFNITSGASIILVASLIFFISCFIKKYSTFIFKFYR